MSVYRIISTVGSGVAILCGGYTTLVSAIDPINEGFHTSVAGLYIAIGGLITAVGAQLQAGFKLYLEERREQRRAAEVRHDLANKLNLATIELKILKIQHDEMNKTIEDNRILIHLLASRDNPPSEEHPDPAKEFSEASKSIPLPPNPLNKS